MPLPDPSRLARLGAALWGAALLAATGLPRPASAETENSLPACYPTAGGALEICRSLGEPEGLLFAPPPCAFAYGVQILRLKWRGAPGPLQFVYHAEPKRETRRGHRGAEDGCPGDLRATDPSLGGTLRTGRQAEQLVATMPPSAYRFWAGQATSGEAPRRKKRRRGRRAREEQPQEIRMVAAAEEASGARDPMTVAGRDWAGDDTYAVLMLATETNDQGRRHVLIQARTADFEHFDLRTRDESGATAWTPFGEEASQPRRRGRRNAPSAPALAPVLDEAGKPITGHCAAQGAESRGLVGSVSVVDQTYYYFYTDVLPSDCGEPAAKRRMGLYLRTSKDVMAERSWSAPRMIIEGLPPDTLMRVAKAKGMERWAVAYSCFRPANAPGGPVADVCLQYTATLAPGAIAGLTLFSEPVGAVRSPAFLGLRSGGDGSGRYGRDGFFWMTDRYGNLDTPSIYPGKDGFLTWLDRQAPRSDGSEGSSLYGRPVYWSTWSVRTR